MNEFDLAALLAGILTAGATLAGFGFAGRQIRQSAEQLRLATEQHHSAESWRRTEFAVRLMDRLIADEELAFCSRALDWGLGPLIVPTKHRVLFPKETSTFEHDWNTLARALRPNLDRDWQDPKLLTYRYSFDALGAFLESLQRHLTLGNIQRVHLIGLDYYLELLATAVYYTMMPSQQKLAGVEAEDVFRDFMRTFYPEAWDLIETRKKGATVARLETRASAEARRAQPRRLGKEA